MCVLARRRTRVSLKPLDLQQLSVCVLARRRILEFSTFVKLRRVRAGTPAHTRGKTNCLEPLAQLRNHRPRRVISEVLQSFIGRSPGAYLREATVTGAFKRTCRAT